MLEIDKKIKKILLLACKTAGKTLLKSYNSKKVVKSKGNNDWVTEYDIKIEKSITRKTKAIIAVNLYGQMANLVEIKKLTNKYNLHLIEDAAQSHGAKNKKNLNVGAFSIFLIRQPLELVVSGN